MKRLFTLLGFSWICLAVHGNPMHVSCDEDVSVLQSHYSISFGDAIETGLATDLPLSISWKVAPQSGVSKVSGTGKATGKLVFSKPGKYEITFVIPAHGDHPGKTETVTVEVSSVQMTFDLKNPVFSTPLATGTISRINMTIPVTVKSYDGKPVEYAIRDVQTTGVAAISSHLKNDKTVLKNGENSLVFELSGTVSTKGNVQFRVYDTTGEAHFFNYSITH
ncbi:MAG: hypothetical protein ACO1N0_08475 [Fluviicola sp.]